MAHEDSLVEVGDPRRMALQTTIHWRTGFITSGVSSGWTGPNSVASKRMTFAPWPSVNSTARKVTSRDSSVPIKAMTFGRSRSSASAGPCRHSEASLNVPPILMFSMMTDMACL